MIMTSLRFKLLLLMLLNGSLAIAGSKTIDGGAGSDSLKINHAGVSSLKDFSLSNFSVGDVTYIRAIDNDGNVIDFTRINQLDISDINYSFAPSTTINSGDGGLSNAFYSTNQKTIHSYGSSVWYAQNICSGSHSLGFSCNDSVQYIGSDSQESLNLNVDRTVMTGTWTIDLGAGNDSISSAKLKNADSIDLGAGDDTAYIMIGGSYGTPTLGTANFTKLDGGEGTDILAFTETAGSNGQTLSLTTGGATNFENLIGSSYNEILQGDANANALAGDNGDDTLYGYAGDDRLAAGGYGVINSSPEMLAYSLSGSGNDLLYGGSGNDELYGNAGDNTLDGGTGSDIIYTGDGSDVIVIRSGDGGSALTGADVIKDFSDGNDVLGLDDVGFDNLTILQGSNANSDHVVVSMTTTSEYLSIIENINVSDMTALDFASTSTVNQTLNGSDLNNTLIGGAGNDTFTTGAGIDILLGSAGNDAITVDGSGDKTLDGGSGADTLTINLSGIASLTDYVVTTSNGYTVLTDVSGNVIQYQNIESVIVGGVTYQPVDSMAINSGDGGLSNALYSTSENTIHSTGNSVFYAQVLDSNSSNNLGLSGTSALSFYGSSGQESLNLNVDRTVMTGTWTIDLGAGNDSISSAKLKNADSIDLGAGDDTAYIMIGGSYGTPTLGTANFTKLDGGEGTDILAFTETAGSNGQTLSLTTGGATNFENLIGSSYNEILQGDANANALAGDNGDDTLYGYAGDDRLAAGGYGVINSSPEMLAYSLSGSGNDLLYGGSGNDELYGNAGDNTLDGGTGSDIIYTGDGSDVIVIRSGDGGSALTGADVIKDFSDGNDIIGLDELNYSDLTVEQGAGDYSNHIVVKKTDTGEFLTIIQNINISAIDDNDFSAI